MKNSMLSVVCASVVVFALGNAADLVALTKYFGTVSGTVPLTLADELAQTDALNHTNYYVGNYDWDGRLVSARQISQGQTILRHEYTYDVSGTIVQARITDAQGISLYRTDQSGNLQLVPED